MTMTKVLAFKTKERPGKHEVIVVIVTFLVRALVVLMSQAVCKHFLLSFGHNVNKNDVE